MVKLAVLVLGLAVQEDPQREFEKRLRVDSTKEQGTPFHRVLLDDFLLHRDFGEVPKGEIVEEDGVRFLTITRDGSELLKVQIPNFDKPALLPPVVVDDTARVEVKSTVRNGLCEVTVNGKKVYSGPGSKVRSNASVRSESINGKKTTRRFIEVYVDDRLVYKAGEAIPDPDPKRNKDDRYF